MRNRIYEIIFSSIMIVALAGCGDSECSTDADCGQGQLCAEAGGVLFASKICVADPGDGAADMSMLGDQGSDLASLPDQTDNQSEDTGGDAAISTDMTIDPDLCGQESNEEFCTRLGKNCGLVNDVDNCGVMRTVRCGGCTEPDECSTTNICGCEAETNTEFCGRLGLDCDSVTAEDDCGMMRTVNCGSCDANETCGEQAPNVCGCPCNIGGTCYPDGAQNPANPCEVCDPQESTTSWSLRTGSCSDGDPCTENDQCNSAGVCVGSPKLCRTTGQCQNAVCDPDNGQCVAMNISGSCNDSDPCTINDSCSNGTCSGIPRNCSVSSQCQTGSCNPSTGQCVTTDVSGSCDDGNPCTANDSCVSGSCQGTQLFCPNNGQCQDSSCNPSTGMCETTNLTGSCDDGNLCTQNDSCSNGMCTGQTIACADPGVCQSASCNPSTGNCETTNDPNGSSCNDGLFCTVNDSCTSGSCDGAPRQCPTMGITCALFCDEFNTRCSQIDPMCIEE